MPRKIKQEQFEELMKSDLLDAVYLNSKVCILKGDGFIEVVKYPTIKSSVSCIEKVESFSYKDVNSAFIQAYEKITEKIFDVKQYEGGFMHGVSYTV